LTIFEEPPAADAVPLDDGSGGKPRTASPIGAVTVPPWQEGTGPSVLPRACQDLVEVAEDARRPLRAGEFAVATGLPARGWLAGELAGPAAAGLTAFELEELVDEESRRAVRQLVQDHYDLRALLCRQDPGAVHAVGAAGPIGRLQGHRDAPGGAAGGDRETGEMRTRLTAGEKPNRKRMAALVTVYDAEPAPAPTLVPGAGAGHQLALIRAEAARRGVTIHVIIDIIHVLELYGAPPGASTRPGMPPLPGKQARVPALRPGPASRLADRDRCHRGRLPPSHSRSSLSQRGQVGPGRRRGHILSLRAVIANDDFEECWRYHLAREHLRLYPGVNQGQYTLGA
jgi:hypothetical protein